MWPPATRAIWSGIAAAVPAPTSSRAVLRVIFIAAILTAGMTKLQQTAACALLSAPLAWAWHDPVHARITRAAFGSLPAAMQQPWRAQAERLAVEYSLYPDAYHNATPETRAAMRRFCEV